MDERQYLDFDLLIGPSGAGDYTGRVVRAPSGEVGPVRLQFPFSDLEIENFLLKIGRPRRGSTRGLASPEALAVREFGGRLFEAIFKDEIRVAFANSLQQAETKGAGLRLRLRVSDAPELANLPWEYLYDRSAASFVALSEWTPLVRYLDLPGIGRPTHVDLPMRILVLVSSPTDFQALDAADETEKLRTALTGLESDGRVTIDLVSGGTFSALQRHLRHGAYHVFHYIGHGGFDPRTDDGVIILEDENGRGRPVSGSDVGVLLHDHRTLRMVVLNTCEGARGGLADPYAGTAQSLVRQGIPAVIAMQFEITDQAAITFSRTFYESVADGYPLDASMAEARKAIYGESNPVEWGTPVLYLRAADGQIFDIAPGSPIPSRLTAPGPAPRPVAAVDASPIPEDPVYTDAVAAYTDGRWDEAVSLLGRVLRRDPSNAEAAARLTSIVHKQRLTALERDVVAGKGNWEAIARELRELHELEPDNQSVTARLDRVDRLAALETKLRRQYEARDWRGVLEVAQQMTRIDSKSGDPDGLATTAKWAMVREEAMTPQEPVPRSRRAWEPLAPIAPLHRVTSLAAASQQFRVTRFKEGYDEDEVADFLDQVQSTLVALEQSRAARSLLRASDVAGRTFTVARLRESYNRSDVDNFLRRVAETLTYYEDAGRYPR
jgi:DivIVA domain-containing protein